MKKLVGILAVAILLTGCADLETEGQTSDSQTEADQTPSKGDKKDTAKKGQTGSLSVGNWEVVGKLKPKKEQFTGDFKLTFRVKNTGDSQDSGLFTVNVLKGNNILTSMDCTTGRVAPGNIGTADCISTDKFRKGWTEVTIENMF